MKLNPENVNRLQTQAAAARAKAAAAAEESEDLARRAARLECLEDADAPRARKDSQRYAELAARFEADAARLDREAAIAGATLARDQAREELKEVERALMPFIEASRATAKAYGVMEQALSAFVAIIPATRLGGLSYPTFSFTERVGVERFYMAAAMERNGQDGRLPYEGERIALEHLAAELPKLLAPAQAELARAEAELAEVRK